MSGRWFLPPLWFDLCWEIGGFDEYPFPIAVASHGATLEERAVLRQRLMPDMQAGGVLDGAALTPEFARVLGQIAKPGLWIEGLWMPDDSQSSPARLLCVAFERDSILVVQEPGPTESTGGDMTITVCPNTSVAAAAVQGMPPAPPGTQPRIAAPASALRPDSGSDDVRGSGLVRAEAPRRADPAASIRQRVDAAHFRDGQFTANLRDATGRHRRSEVLCWFDAFEPDGRYGVTRRARAGYEPEVVLAPLGPADIRAALDQRIAEIRG